jgi:hypothetical protein
MIDPTEDEISFLQKLALRGGELTLQGNMGLLKIDRLIPDYVTLVNAGRETGVFTSPKRAGNFRGNIRESEARAKGGVCHPRSNKTPICVGCHTVTRVPVLTSPLSGGKSEAPASRRPSRTKTAGRAETAPPGASLV